MKIRLNTPINTNEIVDAKLVSFNFNTSTNNANICFEYLDADGSLIKTEVKNLTLENQNLATILNAISTISLNVHGGIVSNDVIAIDK